MWPRPPVPAPLAASQPRWSRRPSFRALRPAGQGRTDARTPEPGRSMWKLGRGRVLLDELPEEEDGLAGGPPPSADAQNHEVCDQKKHVPRSSSRQGLGSQAVTGISAVSPCTWPHVPSSVCPSVNAVSRVHVLGVSAQASSVPQGAASENTGHRSATSQAVPPLTVQGASFRGWKEVTSLFSNDDEQHLLGTCRSPKARGTSLRLKEELKMEKKSGFWDNLVLKQNLQPKKPDEIEGWEPPKLALEDVAAESGDGPSVRGPRPGWEEGAKGSGKYTSLAGPGSSSRWSLKSAGKLVSIRRQSRGGHLTDTWEELE
ncbi:testis development-related protein isoform X1 [Artibeus jamaicensis]|uniref:testis development-related protein isoform X1 n=1 Tax=Artibeus jamaicensis TaxID=9417 RepID=UPI00235ABF76|nr:testis development-related protein isoform X1 [Artibeus jamaicensis]